MISHNQSLQVEFLNTNGDTKNMVDAADNNPIPVMEDKGLNKNTYNTYLGAKLVVAPFEPEMLNRSCFAWSVSNVNGIVYVNSSADFLHSSSLVWKDC